MPAAGGGVATGEADLWCTYAAIRTLCWLDAAGAVPDACGTADYLASRRNADGGYAWSRGMASDAWATYYCTQALADLTRGDRDALRFADRTAAWLRSCAADGGGFAMTPGQAADAWATFYVTRTLADACGQRVDGESLSDWLGALQASDGGLAWSPAHAARGDADVRACFYGVMAWRTVAAADRPTPWDGARLRRWLRAQQAADGGFRFSAHADTSCLWATYRATSTLDALEDGPADVPRCLRWIGERRGPGGGFVRWDGYDVEDVWAAFCAVGSLRALARPAGQAASGEIAASLRRLTCRGGGFTYRQPENAADALAPAADALARPHAAEPHRRWLDGCLLPNEGGVMYMPARGAEVRCTLWALEAGAIADPAARRRAGGWLARLQNPDGGLGYWEGRGSDVVSTVSALEIDRLVGGSPIDRVAASGFIERCRTAEGYGNVPGAKAAALRPTLQALRARRLLGDGDAGAVTAALERHRVAGGGWANEGDRLSDLLTTYEAVLCADRHDIAVDRTHAARLTARLAVGGGAAWTPLAAGDGGPLARCLHALLERRLRDGAALPALALS
jgi:prenyltransferase beta subunit